MSRVHGTWRMLYMASGVWRLLHGHWGTPCGPVLPNYATCLVQWPEAYHAYAYSNTYSHICTHVYTHISRHMSAHMPIHMPTHMFIHIYTHTCLQTSCASDYTIPKRRMCNGACEWRFGMKFLWKSAFWDCQSKPLPGWLRKIEENAPRSPGAMKTQEKHVYFRGTWELACEHANAAA